MDSRNTKGVAVDVSRFDWLGAILGVMGGAFAAIVALFGWFGKKMAKFDRDIKDLEFMVQACQINMKEQQVHHEDNQRRLHGIEDAIKDLSDRQEERFMIIVGKLSNK